VKKSRPAKRSLAEVYLDVVGVMLVALDRDGRITMVNPRTCQILGRPAGELVGREWFDTCVPERLRRSVRGVFQRITAGELSPVSEYENHVVTASGEERLIAWRNTMLLDADGRPTGTLSAGEDVTEHRRREAALRLNEERLEALFQLSQAGEMPEDQLFEFALEEGVRLTRSRIGYLHLVHDDQVSLTLAKWSKAVADACTAAKVPHYPLADAGIWADCVRLRKPVVHNDYAAEPGRKGLPEGHFPVIRHMSVPVFDGGKVAAVAGVGNKDDPYDESDVRQLELFMHGLWSVLRERRSRAALRKTLDGTVEAISRALETRDPYTAGHQRRVAGLARAVAAEMGLSPDQIDAIGLAGSIHDIGKLSVPAEILAKPAKLSTIEFGLIKLHPRTGYEMLKPVEFPWPLHDFILQHHERLDGSGYPDRLAGEAIRLEARVLAVADIVEAMASHRPYRPAFAIGDALAEIRRQRGLQLDADAVDACIRLFEQHRYALPA
jgi:PAS domain S-box-containing protein